MLQVLTKDTVVSIRKSKLVVMSIFQAFFCAFWPKLISAKMGKLISKIVKLISETEKLISANPKTHFLRVFQAVLCYLLHKLTCNVQEKAKY